MIHRLASVALISALACTMTQPLTQQAQPTPPPAVGAEAAPDGSAVDAGTAAVDAGTAAHKSEEAQRAGAPPPRIHAVHETVPADVLDRLDHARPDTPTPLVAPQP